MAFSDLISTVKNHVRDLFYLPSKDLKCETHAELRQKMEIQVREIVVLFFLCRCKTAFSDLMSTVENHVRDLFYLPSKDIKCETHAEILQKMKIRTFKKWLFDTSTLTWKEYEFVPFS